MIVNFIESNPNKPTFIKISTEAEEKEYKETMNDYKNYFKNKLNTATKLDRTNESHKTEIDEINAKLLEFRDEPYLTLTITDKEGLANLDSLRKDINDLANKLYSILNPPTIIGRPPFDLNYYIENFLQVYFQLNPLKPPLKDYNQIHELLTNILGENYQKDFLNAYNLGYDNASLTPYYEKKIKKFESQESLKNSLKKLGILRKQSRKLHKKTHNSRKESREKSRKESREKSRKESREKSRYEYDLNKLGDSMDIDTTGGRGYKTKKHKKTKNVKKTKNHKKTKNVKKTKKS